MENKRNSFSTMILVVMLLASFLISVPVEADGPVDVQFVGINALTYSGANQTGELTANLTIRQGDYLDLEIPVENTGGDSQVASIVLEINQSGWNETVYFESITIDSMSTHVLNYLSSRHVMEGMLHVEMSINNTSETLVDSIQVGPPPLPSIDVNVEAITESYASGDLIQFNLTSSNTNGERAFAGQLICDFLNDEVYNETLALDVGQVVTVMFDIYARPGVVECSLEGDRNQSSETAVNYSLEGLASAIFSEAGSSGFSILGGPWHQGDDLTTSFILRNQGDAAGSVQLKVMHDAVEYTSDSLLLDAGAAGELRLNLEDLDEGIHALNWSIISLDGIVSSELEGMSTITVLPPQEMYAEVHAAIESSGVSLHWNVSITDGVDRDVKIRFGYRLSGTDVYVHEQIVTLGSGTLTGQTTLGDVPGDTVLVRMEPVDWLASSNSYIATSTFEIVEIDYALDIDAISLPREPVEGGDVTVTVTLQNAGLVDGPSGELYLRDSDGLLLAQSTTEPLQASSSRNIDFRFVVPNGNEMLLTAEWRYGAQVVEDEQSFLVTAKPVEEASFEIPFLAIGAGLATASCVILVLHLRRGTSSEESTDTQPTKSKEKKRKQEEKKAEPVEKTCPACERTLRIPGDYSGTVRCPDCSEKFQVEAEESIDIDDELESIDEPEPIEKVVESKIEIACPECSSKLRVPSTYRGSVRCPSCSNVFSAA